MDSSLKSTTRAIVIEESLNQRLFALAQKTLLLNKEDLADTVSKKNCKPSANAWLSLLNMIDLKKGSE